MSRDDKKPRQYDNVIYEGYYDCFLNREVDGTFTPLRFNPKPNRGSPQLEEFTVKEPMLSKICARAILLCKNLPSISCSVKTITLSEYYKIQATKMYNSLSSTKNTGGNPPETKKESAAIELLQKPLTSQNTVVNPFYKKKETTATKKLQSFASTSKETYAQVLKKASQVSVHLSPIHESDLTDTETESEDSDRNSFIDDEATEVADFASSDDESIPLDDMEEILEQDVDLADSAWRACTDEVNEQRMAIEDEINPVKKLKMLRQFMKCQDDSHRPQESMELESNDQDLDLIIELQATTSCQVQDNNTLTLYAEVVDNFDLQILGEAEPVVKNHQNLDDPQPIEETRFQDALYRMKLHYDNARNSNDPFVARHDAFARFVKAKKAFKQLIRKQNRVFDWGLFPIINFGTHQPAKTQERKDSNRRQRQNKKNRQRRHKYQSQNGRYDGTCFSSQDVANNNNNDIFYDDAENVQEDNCPPTYDWDLEVMGDEAEQPQRPIVYYSQEYMQQQRDNYVTTVFWS